ncbi:MAG: zinc ABC transporter substrate-binding protein [Dysgonamonadaceae bacterium]|nr:zinc ABC transporter substrate-binding protein [Dysgonamonadaceae bacterium]MDD3356302.1 zinc ABC transporter substrate-binding protein [Dysgonamonadaceae bacterium]MDD3728520.1 zinc ABC transporter substrate-binding protein [Dysgonamonadaceae bacterium]MDD4247393.1 zinc ABC transporter substrate-binding protein [Dysgonamonadaceae bacterium]MDD4605467.1 zinc ABC transporter substrate-binding protein [Dysgonamonadaceae bacterium]
MKNYLYLSLILLFALSCNIVNENRPTITVSIEPQRYFVEQIVGDKFRVNTIVPAGTSPETYDPTPSQMIELGKSTLYFKVGYLGFENAWGKNLEENNVDVDVINCSNNINLIEGENHSIEIGENDEHEGHNHQGVDPHIWSSPKSALIMAENMLNALVVADEENQKQYRENFKKLETKIKDTDQKIRELLENAPVKSFIIYHPALGYLARDYNLTQYSIEFEGKNPSPQQLKVMIDFAREQGIRTIFVQKGFDIKNAESLAKEVGASIHSIDPLSYDWSDELIKVAQILANNE